MASNDSNRKRKLEEEAESSSARKRLRLSDDDDSSDSSKEETEEEEEEEISSEETSMNNQLDTSEEKLQAMCTHGIAFSDDGDTNLPSLEPRTPKVTNAPTRIAVMMMTTSGCRYKSIST
jgi:hypothetical protein